MIEKNKLNAYLEEISQIPLLEPEEEVELARRIKQNDHEALNKLVSSNLKFVVSVCKSYQNNGLALEDLINEGNVGLIKAAYRFDESRGFKFISYAVWWIR
ncbi:MAG: sigma-70 family RNA polymerase sigma factor, partial [Caldithrix sp.]|nr:sigma-70 family RNA polymerase sigma factor [Caldithrix sp.]